MMFMMKFPFCSETMKYFYEHESLLESINLMEVNINELTNTYTI